MNNQNNSSFEYSSLEYSSDEFEYEIGKCCFCGDECNPDSQSCGSCARDMTMMSMGWNTKNTKKIKYTPIQKNKVSDTSKVYFPEFGLTDYMSQEQFRQFLIDNRDKFPMELPYDLHNCDIMELIQFVGASLVQDE